MEILVFLGIALGIGCWAYTCGKQTGSRKGYGVGRAHGRRRW